jgi:hypothetical protein
LQNTPLHPARAQPAVIAVEDLHWADPTTLDLLRGIAERGALAPLFFVITARPEFRAPWGMRSHHGVIVSQAMKDDPSINSDALWKDASGQAAKNQMAVSYRVKTFAL